MSALTKAERPAKEQAFGGRGDRIMSRTVFCVAVTGIIILVFILGFLVANGLPVLRTASLKELFFSRDWYPTEEPRGWRRYNRSSFPARCRA